VNSTVDGGRAKSEKEKERRRKDCKDARCSKDFNICTRKDVVSGFLHLLMPATGRKSRKGGKDEGRKQKTNVAAKSRVPARLNDIVSMLQHLLNSSGRRKKGQETHEFSNQVPPTVKFFSYRLKSMRSPKCWSRRMAAMIPEKPAPTGRVVGGRRQEKKRDEGWENEEEGEGKKEVSAREGVRERMAETHSWRPSASSRCGRRGGPPA
jgi:hypothetical protein